ncbi:MAG TPA: glycosyltransferase family A protein [bacterium]|nr:glycosyltransferase family A protein [bacterium]
MNQFSIIVPTYRRKIMLEQCLRSIIDQNYDRHLFEIIVVDNSQDGSACEVVEEINRSSDIRIVWINEKKQGLVYARHAGAKIAKYDILVFTDDDAVLDKNWLSEINRSFEKNDEIIAVAGRIEIKWDETPPEWIIEYEPYLGKLNYGDEPFIANDIQINGGNFIIRKEMLFRLKGFNPDQVGEYLVGDGETGLLRKMYKEKCLIGWSPKALMYHCQTVEKNATVKDISRRFFNNGICEAYDSFVVQKQKGFFVINDIVRTIMQIFDIYIRRVLKLDSNAKRSIFLSAYQFGKLSFYKKVIFSQEYRKMIASKDWELK